MLVFYYYYIIIVQAAFVWFGLSLYVCVPLIQFLLVLVLKLAFELSRKHIYK
jgi:hypothetical protein